MAENPYVNKVVFGNDTVLDLTEDSVTENTLLEGETAHKASGEPITGTAKQGHTIWNAIKTALTQRTKLWFADAKVTDDSTEQTTKVEVVQLIDDESELTNAPDGVYQGDYEDAPEDVLDASMVAYKDGSVEDALDELTTKNSFSVGSGIALSANTSVAITAPSDGYLIIYSTNTDTRVLIAPNSALSFSFCIAQAESSSLWGFDSMYIRKGATVYVNATGSHGFYCFVKYV